MRAVKNDAANRKRRATAALKRSDARINPKRPRVPLKTALALAPYNGVPEWRVELALRVLQLSTSNDLEDVAEKTLQKALGDG